MKNFVKGAVTKPITVLMSMLIIILLGMFSLTKLSMNIFPDMELPYMAIVTQYTNATPLEVEQEIAKPIETQLKQISGFEGLTSTSNEHYSQILATFSQGTNMDSVRIDLSEKLERIEFPEAASKPMVFQFDISMMPAAVMSISLSDDLVADTITMENQILPALQRVAGVADVSLTGQSSVVVSLDFDDAKIAAYNTANSLTGADELTASGIRQILEKQIFKGEVYYQVSAKGELYIIKKSGKDFTSTAGLAEQIIVKDTSKTYTLSDFTKENGIKLADNDNTKFSWVNGKPAMTVSFTKQSNYDTIKAVKNIEKAISELKKDFPTLEVITIMSQAEMIQTSIGSVTSSLLWGAALAVVVLLLFLKDIRPTGVIAVTIPVAVVGTFVLMYFSGISLNIISMGGLALGIGMLVDNAVVVIENIYRLIRNGHSKKEAAIEGAAQVAGAIVASTLTTISVFLPIFFISNMYVDMLKDLALTISFSLIASLIISLSLVPSLANKTLKQEMKISAGIIGKLRDVYENTIKFVLRRRWVTLLIVVIFLPLSIFLAFSRGVEMFPSEATTAVDVSVQMEKNTQMATTVEYLTYVDQQILKEKYASIIETRTVAIGAGGFSMMGGGFVDTTQGNISVTLKDSKKLAKFKRDFAKDLEEIDYSKLPNVSETNVKDVKVEDGSSGMSMGMTGSDISVKVAGLDDQTIRNIANDLVEELSKIKGLKEVSNGIPESGLEVLINVNQQSAIDLGLYESDVMASYKAFNKAFFGSMMGAATSNNTKVVIGGVEYDVIDTAGNVDFSSILAITQTPGFNPTAPDFGIGLVDGNPVKAFLQLYFYMNLELEAQVAMIPVMAENDLASVTNYTFNHVTGIIDVAGATALGTLTDVAEFTVQGRQATITRDENGRYVTVTALFDGKVNENEINTKVKDVISKYKADNKEAIAGYHIEIAGVATEFMELGKELMIAMAVAILLVYMVMAIQFQSLKYPFIVLFTIPLAFTGGLLAIWITGMKLSIVAMVGLIILVGIVVNNGIVLIDYINQLMREENKDLYTAIIEAGRTRLRPIFMTSLTTILGLFVMALGIGEGTETMQPLAVTAIGGLIYSTLLTLLVVPLVYSYMNDFKGRDRNGFLGIRGTKKAKRVKAARR